MIRIAALCVALAVAQGCSVREYAMSRVGVALAGGGDVFATEDDPELARAAAPFSLKLIVITYLPWLSTALPGAFR